MASLLGACTEDEPSAPEPEVADILFRTPPLWGIANTAPYMHDGAALTVEAAIAAHDGEAQASRAAFDALSETDRATLLELLESRGAARRRLRSAAAAFMPEHPPRGARALSIGPEHPPEGARALSIGYEPAT